MERILIDDGSRDNSYEIAKKFEAPDNHIHVIIDRDMKAADLFVCSSIHEGYSTAVTESLVVGTPVVTTLCSGMVELLGAHNEYGIITENDNESLYVAVKQIISDKSMYARYKSATQAKKVELLNADNVTPVINLFN